MALGGLAVAAANRRSRRAAKKEAMKMLARKVYWGVSKDQKEVKCLEFMAEKCRACSNFVFFRFLDPNKTRMLGGGQ